MTKWTTERAVGTIHRLRANTVENATTEQLNLMRKIFVHITVFGELKYDSFNFLVWENENCNLAIIDYVLGEASVVYGGLRYVIENGNEG